MSLSIKHLSEKQINQIHACFLESFSDYQVDMSYLTLERMKKRAAMDRVDYNLSVGVFDEEKMVGFTLIGWDAWKNSYYAFDAGTGIIKEHRGKGLAKEMFDFSIEKLKEKDTKYFALEVLQENEAAIKAYKKSGFEIVENYKGYKLDVNEFKCPDIKPQNITIKNIPKKELKAYFNLLDYEVSWEYNNSAINAINDELYIYGAFVNNRCIGYIVYYPLLHWIFQLTTTNEFRHKGIESILLQKIVNKVKKQTDLIKVHNITENHYLNEIYVTHGFKNYADQYQMEKEL